MTLTILLIEDQPDHARLIQRYLKRAAEAEVAVQWDARLADGVESLGRTDADAVLLDLTLPDSSPEETLARVLAASPDVPVIVLTAQDDRELAVQAVHQGAQDYVVKSGLSGELLLRAIRYAIERKRSERALRELNATLEERVVRRTGYLNLLQDVTVIANESDTVEEALRAAVERIARFMDWPLGHGYTTEAAEAGARPVEVWFLEDPQRFEPFVQATRTSGVSAASGESLRGTISARRSTVWITDFSRDARGSARACAAREAGLHAAFGFPVFAERETAAILEFLTTVPETPQEEFLEVMVHVGTQLGRVVERQRLQRQLIDAVWHSQRRFGQELHDGVGQELGGIALMLDLHRNRLHKEGSAETETAGELTRLVRRSHESVRRLSRGLFPVAVDAEGLRAALADLAATVQAHSGVECVLEAERAMPIHDNNLAVHLFRIAQEALNNALRHAGAQRIHLSLGAEDGMLRLIVRDDGCGLPADQDVQPGLGLRTMRYRAQAIGAQLTIERDAEGGTSIICSRPTEDRHGMQERDGAAAGL